MLLRGHTRPTFSTTATTYWIKAENETENEVQKLFSILTEDTVDDKLWMGPPLMIPHPCGSVCTISAVDSHNLIRSEVRGQYRMRLFVAIKQGCKPIAETKILVSGHDLAKLRFTSNQGLIRVLYDEIELMNFTLPKHDSCPHLIISLSYRKYESQLFKLRQPMKNIDADDMDFVIQSKFSKRPYQIRLPMIDWKNSLLSYSQGGRIYVECKDDDLWGRIDTEELKDKEVIYRYRRSKQLVKIKATDKSAKLEEVIIPEENLDLCEFIEEFVLNYMRVYLPDTKF